MTTSHELVSSHSDRIGTVLRSVGAPESDKAGQPPDEPQSQWDNRATWDNWNNRR